MLRRSLSSTLVVATLGTACGPGADADAPPPNDAAPAPASSLPDPAVYLVDAAGETSRLLRLDPPTWATTELRTLPPGSRGLAPDPRGGGLIWASRDGDVIQRGDLAGENVRDVSVPPPDSAYAVEVGAESGTLYWSDYGTDAILALPRGADGPTVLASGLVSPRAIAVDETAGWIYWVDRGAGRVQRAPLGGGPVEDLVTEGLAAPYGIALDPVDGTLLVADAELGSIFRVAPGEWALEPWLPDAGTHPSFVVVDGPTGWVYWTDNRDNVVRRRMREGGPVEVLAEGFAGPRGLVLMR